MNSKKHEIVDQASTSLDESEDSNPNDDDDGNDEDPLNLSNSNEGNTGMSQTCETLPAKPWTYKEGQFWNYVDDELANVRKVVQDGSSSVSEADAKTTEYVLPHFITSRLLI